MNIRWLLLAIVVVAISLRLGVAVKMGLNAGPRPGSDQNEYDTYAWNLAQGRGYRGPSPDVIDHDHLTAYRPPVTSVTWAGLYCIFGHRYDVVRVFHCVLDGISAVIIFAIGRRCFNERIGLISAAIWAVWPLGLLYSCELLSEPIATFIYLLFLLACLWFAEHPTGLRALTSGILLGMALMARSNYIVMLPLVLLWVIWQFRRQPRALAWGLTILAVSLLCLVPWTARNYHIFGKLIPLSTTAGSALLQGNNDIVATNPAYYGFSIWDTEINEEITRQLRAPNDEYERDRIAKRLAIDWLKSHRDKWVFLVQAKFRRSLTPFLQQPSKSRRLIYFVTWGPILVLFGLAFFPTLLTFLRRDQPGWLIHLAIAHYIINSIAFYALSRYRYPIEGLCIILACVSALWLWDKLRGVHAAST